MKELLQRLDQERIAVSERPAADTIYDPRYCHVNFGGSISSVPEDCHQGDGRPAHEPKDDGYIRDDVIFY